MTIFVTRENLYEAREICQNLHVKWDHDFPVTTLDIGDCLNLFWFYLRMQILMTTIDDLL